MFETETRVSYYRARYYDPQTGRFLSEDPAAVGHYSIYAYAHNSPILWLDPTGQITEQQAQQIINVWQNSGAAVGGILGFLGGGGGGLIGGPAAEVTVPAGALVGAAAGATIGAVAGRAIGTLIVHLAKANDSSGSSCDSDDAPRQFKKLSKGEIKALEDNGIDPHDLKPNSRYDLFKDQDGNIRVMPKDGSGPGDPTGLNIKDFI